MGARERRNYERELKYRVWQRDDDFYWLDDFVEPDLAQLSAG